MNKMNDNINEDFTAYQERNIKRALIKNLEETGHIKFAERLKNYDLKIVPFTAMPDCTAFVRPGDATIYVGEGFINVDTLDEKDVISQLNVLLRHEMSHQLFKHAVRMMKKAGVKLASSSSFHDLLNVIEDDEISNRTYSPQDKEVVRNMKMNRPDESLLKSTMEVIGGLVTEDHRQAWLDLPVEAMYDKLCGEIRKLNASLLTSKGSFKDIAAVQKAKDPVIGWSIMKVAKKYQNPDVGPVYYFEKGLRLPNELKNNATYQSLDAEDKDMIMKTANVIASVPEDKQADKARALVADIAKTSLIDEYTGIPGLTLVSPEDKGFIVSYLKSFYMDKPKTPGAPAQVPDHSPEYIKAYNDAIDTFDREENGKDVYSTDELADLITALTA